MQLDMAGFKNGSDFYGEGLAALIALIDANPHFMLTGCLAL